MNRYLKVILIVFTNTVIWSQTDIQISGVVKDAQSNAPLFGALILVKNTSKGTSTDFNGNFSLTLTLNSSSENNLIVSYLGYQNQEVKIEDKTYFEIALVEDLEALDEVIITSSYGTKKRKEELVGSIVSVRSKDIVTEQNATTFDELLEGQLAGVYIETNPRLGEEVSIDIRGQGSLTPLEQNIVGTSTQPLIIIDGIILSEEVGIDGSNLFDVGTGNISENILNPLARVGIHDIENFQVLKDAAAVGIYGADAANGVILITSKKGKLGKPVFNASIQAGFQNPMNQFQYLDGEQYRTILNQYYLNNGDFENIEEWNGVNTNWFDLLNDIGTFYRYTLGVNGGGERLRYRFNTTYQINNETQVANTFDNLNSTLALDYNNKKFNVVLNISPALTEKNDPNTLYNFAVDPTISVFDDDGNYTNFPSYGNPVAVANQNRRQIKTFALLTSINLNYQFNDKLRFTTLFGMDYSNKDEDRFFSGLNGSGQFNDGDLGRRILRDRDTNRWNWSANLFYNTTFNDHHNFDALAGIETRQEHVELSYARGNNFTNFATPQPIALATDNDYQNDSFENTGRSFFSQINYNFKKKYFLLFNARIDQSSAFGNDRNTAFNAGAGASWNISNEDFFDPNGNSFIDFLRLRLSLGTTGNSRIGSYRALGLYTVSDNGTGYNDHNYANPSSAPNPNLGWEQNTKFNIGIDIKFLDKFNLTAEYFRDTIDDLITSRPTISEVGFNEVQINGASMYNQGFELSLQAKWFNNENFSWTTNFNISTLQNKITDLQGLGSQFSLAENALSRQVGFAQSTIWGFNFIGIDPATGRELFDLNGETYDASYVAENFNESNWTPIGDRQPDMYGGFRNTINYKNFTFSMIWSYAIGQDALIDRNLVDNYRVLFNRNLSVNLWQQAWQQQGDLAQYPIISNSNRIIANSSKYVFDESHFRLRTINLGYNVPVNKLRLSLKSLNVFTNGSNLFYWFFNPVNDFGNGIAELRNVYPEMRTFSLGLNATF
ncbi:MAG: SusC/RagA family TonB-linked outer membrane protein [Flavobacteriaceae bacterium]|nr:SusC/RagA family TonB-linked outer membrane protein [Flavobacteriaceae bacterium]